jgi:hypothetical protein
MSESEDETKGFKVTDRRKFTPKGELRNDAEASTERAPAEQEAEAAPPSQPSHEDAPASPTTAHTEAAEPASELGLLDLVSMLATNALVQLGDVPDPASGEKMENMRAVQDMISFLGILQNKTKGNLSTNEEEVLEQVLYDLRMRYMAKANILKL